MYCSTIEVRKNHHLLLRIWERLRRRLPENLLPRLVFIGRWGWGIEPIRLWVERDWRMAPHLVVLEGITDDVLALLYRRALFTVFPSFAEGFGMPVAESLACGTPVLTGTHPALREASEGLMPAIDPDDLLGWESMILALLQSPERIMDLRAAAARYRGAEPGLLGRKVANATERFLLHSSV
jgi:glycosyltransferase involved in cell wall biosynthesis